MYRLHVIQRNFSQVFDASWPGSVHESRIWKHSHIRTKMMTYQNCVLIVDSGYGIEPLLMTPYANPQNNLARKYNALFKAERVIIERCFGQLKRRFPFLHHPCRIALVQVPKLIFCCVVLHNIAKYLHDPAIFFP